MFATRDGFDFEIYNATSTSASAGMTRPGRRSAGCSSRSTAPRCLGRLPAVVLFPVHIQIMGSVGDVRPQESARAVCGRLGVPFHDLLLALRAGGGTTSEAPTTTATTRRRASDPVAKDTLAWLDGKLIPPRP
jgi:hypothetical protein